MVYFEWKAPATLQFTASGWGVTQQRLHQQLQAAGFQPQYVSWEIASYLPFLYALVIKGQAPEGINNAEQAIANIAEAAGFSIDRGAVVASFGGALTVFGGSGGGGGNDDPFGLDTGMVGIIALALVAVVVVPRLLDRR